RKLLAAANGGKPCQSAKRSYQSSITKWPIRAGHLKEFRTRNSVGSRTRSLRRSEVWQLILRIFPAGRPRRLIEMNWILRRRANRPIVCQKQSPGLRYLKRLTRTSLQREPLWKLRVMKTAKANGRCLTDAN